MKDTINPGHYKQGKFETIDVILDIVQHLPGDEAVLVGNIIKYVSRYNLKSGREDIEKAQWYAKRLSKLLKEKEKQAVLEDLDELGVPLRPEVSI